MYSENFQKKLQNWLPNYLEKHRIDFKNEVIRVFDICCFPWQGAVELSFLTTNEPNFDEEEYGKYSVADWKLYSFNYEILKDWEESKNIFFEMRQLWEDSQEFRDMSGELYTACAQVAISNDIKKVLSKYQLAVDFEITVFDPDDHEKVNYCKSVNK